MKIERKVYAFIISMILLGVVIGSIYADRTITDMNDDIYTKIRCSNGNVYAATGANIQTAIDSVYASGGGTVWLPAGILYHTTYIYLKDNTALVGAGMGVTIIKSASGNNVGKIRAMPTENGNHNITIRDVTVECNSSGGNGIYFKTISDFLVQNVEVLNAGNNAFSFSSTCTRGIIDNIQSFNSDASLSGSYHGIAVDDARHCFFTNILIMNPQTSGFDISSCQNVTVDNLMVIDSAGYGGKVYSGLSGDPRGNNNILSNIRVYNATSAVSNAFRVTGEDNLQLHHIDIKNVGYTGLAIQNCNNVILDGFIIENTGLHGLYIESSTAIYQNNIKVSNGIVKNAANRGFLGRYLYNFTMDNVIFDGCGLSSVFGNSKHAIISRCTFTKSDQLGLVLESNSFFKIVDSFFMYNVGDGLDSTSGACHNYSVIGNTFAYNAQGFDCHASDDYNIITLNHFIDDTLDDHSATKGYVANNIGDDI